MRILFMGTGAIGAPTLRWLHDQSDVDLAGIFTQPDKPAGRALKLRASPIKEMAMDWQVPIFQPQRLRAAEAVEVVRNVGSDLIVVMAYGQILPRAVLQAPRLACLNLHASLLPRHRGAAPIQAAIEAGDPFTGITVMYMAEGLDTGDILLKRELRIGRRETGGSLHDRLASVAPEALSEALVLLAEGRAPRVPQDETAATYSGKLTREHGEISWKSSALEIDRRIRAMNPWPAAHTWLPTPEGLRQLKVFGCIQHRRESGAPGVVLRADRRGLLVAAGSGAVLLREVQLEGRKRLPAGDFLLGHRVAPGTQLGRS